MRNEAESVILTVEKSSNKRHNWDPREMVLDSAAIQHILWISDPPLRVDFGLLESLY
jgi:hypothetical protein